MMSADSDYEYRNTAEALQVAPSERGFSGAARYGVRFSRASLIPSQMANAHHLQEKISARGQ